MKFRYQISYMDSATGEQIAKAKTNVATYDEAKSVIELYQAQEAKGEIKINSFAIQGNVSAAAQLVK